MSEFNREKYEGYKVNLQAGINAMRAENAEMCAAIKEFAVFDTNPLILWLVGQVIDLQKQVNKLEMKSCMTHWHDI